jgi:hypothetical protein
VLAVSRVRFPFVDSLILVLESFHSETMNSSLGSTIAHVDHVQAWELSGSKQDETDSAVAIAQFIQLLRLLLAFTLTHSAYSDFAISLHIVSSSPT